MMRQGFIDFLDGNGATVGHQRKIENAFVRRILKEFREGEKITPIFGVDSF